MSFHVLFAVLIVNFILLLIFFFEAINTNHFDTALTCHSYLFFLNFWIICLVVSVCIALYIGLVILIIDVLVK